MEQIYQAAVLRRKTRDTRLETWVVRHALRAEIKRGKELCREIRERLALEKLIAEYDQKIKHEGVPWHLRH